jgi:hypothetical protein
MSLFATGGFPLTSTAASRSTATADRDLADEAAPDRPMAAIVPCAGNAGSSAFAHTYRVLM